jgi:hypothetical protein
MFLLIRYVSDWNLHNLTLPGTPHRSYCAFGWNRPCSLERLIPRFPINFVNDYPEESGV